LVCFLWQSYRDAVTDLNSDGIHPTNRSNSTLRERWRRRFNDRIPERLDSQSPMNGTSDESERS
jgi:hypothetical protein